MHHVQQRHPAVPVIPITSAPRTPVMGPASDRTLPMKWQYPGLRPASVLPRPFSSSGKSSVWSLKLVPMDAQIH